MRPRGGVWLLWSVQMLFTCPVALGSVACPPGPWATVRRGTGYYVHPAPPMMTWDKARDYCGQLGGSLLLPKSADENAVAGSLLRKHRTPLAWLNCRRAWVTNQTWQCEVNGEYMYVRHSDIYTNLASSGIPEGLSGPLCGIMNGTDATWNAMSCNREATAVCQRPVTERRASPMYCMTMGADGRPQNDGKCVY